MLSILEQSKNLLVGNELKELNMILVKFKSNKHEIL